MTLRVNGKEIELSGIENVTGLLTYYRVENKIVVVERNGEIVDRSQYETTPVMDGDRIEIVHFVGGG